MKWNPSLALAACALAGQGAQAAIPLDLDSRESISRASSTIAADLMKYYTGNRPGDTPGNLPDPYFWWEAGAMFGTMINYWYLTGDEKYNAITQQALLHQVGEEGAFMPDNQTKTLGNDDQGFWGMAAMTAAETGFPDPPDGQLGWLALAQGVFNTQAPRWDMSACGGGLRWQIFPFNTGFNYKNSISNGCFFNIAARLALYTGNTTYNEWAERTWDWVVNTGLITPDYQVFDGAWRDDNCSRQDRTRWTYNAGVFLLGGAAMYNATGSPVWRQRVTDLLNATDVFFLEGVLYEPCEFGRCNIDQRSFKAYLSRWLAATAELAPFTHDMIVSRLRSSAQAAIQTCTAGASGTECGLNWRMGGNDGSLGVGEQMAALEIVQSNLVSGARGWVSAVKGTGTSKGDVNAGSEAKNDIDSLNQMVITTGDRVGAGFLTLAVLLGVMGGTATMVMGV